MQRAGELLSEAPPRLRDALTPCGGCHFTELSDYTRSVHAGALRNNHDTPTCLDCHGWHYISAREDLESSGSAGHQIKTCGQCHGNATVMAKYDLSSNTVQTYEESFHGKKSALGSARAAVCTSCHQAHDIKSTRDPESPLFPANRAATCAQCHPRASRQFALAFTHRPRTREASPLVYWITVAYKLAIGGAIVGMSAYVVLDLWRRLLIRFRG